MDKTLALAILVVPLLPTSAYAQRPRAREAGIETGTLPTGPLNAITDVAGVRVGQATVVRPPRIRTGVTAILPHGGNLFREKVAGAVFTFNGFGKLAGSTQVDELGEIETPILLTSTLNIPRVADALLDYMLALPGNEGVLSINTLVAETNDGALNDIRGRHVGREHVFAALESAKSGPVEEGAVGAGAGTVCFRLQRRHRDLVPPHASRHTVVFLVQTNYGGDLRIAGVPVGRLLKQDGKGSADGSVIVVVATDRACRIDPEPEAHGYPDDDVDSAEPSRRANGMATTPSPSPPFVIPPAWSRTTPCRPFPRYERSDRGGRLQFAVQGRDGGIEQPPGRGVASGPCPAGAAGMQSDSLATFMDNIDSSGTSSSHGR